MNKHHQQVAMQNRTVELALACMLQAQPSTTQGLVWALCSYIFLSLDIGGWVSCPLKIPQQRYPSIDSTIIL